MAQTFRRKPNRLPLPSYAETHAYQITMVTSGRKKEFNEALVGFSLDKLRLVSEKRSAGIIAYCFMPDHLHVLALLHGPTSLIDFVRDFKQLTGYEFKKRTGRNLWQKSYHDHVSRSEDSLLKSARYIAANPVRAGLAACPSDWPWLGSFVWQRSALVEG